MKIIYLKDGAECLVDDTDYEELNKVKWHRMDNKLTTYAVRRPLIEGKKSVVYLHSLILKRTENFIIDHIDGNGLNNTRNNLRLVTHQQNNHNRRKSSINTTGYKGVTYCKKQCKFVASITFSNKRVFLGLYDTAEEAALAYNQAAMLFFKEFAVLNEIIVKKVYNRLAL